MNGKLVSSNPVDSSLICSSFRNVSLPNEQNITDLAGKLSNHFNYFPSNTSFDGSDLRAS